MRATAGECLPVELEPEEWDAEGFALWARTNFGAELAPEAIRGMDRGQAIELVSDAALAKFAVIDLSPTAEFLVPDFGARQLASWANRKFGTTFDAGLFAGATTPAAAAEAPPKGFMTAGARGFGAGGGIAAASAAIFAASSFPASFSAMNIA